MKFIVASDLHGSAEAFAQVVAAFEHEKANYIILCGDYLYHGPRNNLPIGYEPKDLAPLLNEQKEKIIAVRGNCDCEVDQMLLDFPIMQDYALVFNEGRRYFITHGHIYNEFHMPGLGEGDVFISGHTHVPRLDVIDGIVHLNPGSTTIPKALSKPGYALLDESHAELKTLDGFHTLKTHTF